MSALRCCRLGPDQHGSSRCEDSDARGAHFSGILQAFRFAARGAVEVPLTTRDFDLPEALRGADAALRAIGVAAELEAWPRLREVHNQASVAPVDALKRRAGLDGDELERLLLWHAARQSLSRVPSVPVEEAVRVQLDQDLRQLLKDTASAASGAPLATSSYQFVRAAQIATLRRFSSGPLEWEVDAVIPRSWLLKPAFPDNVRMLTFVALRLGGRGPCFFVHVAPPPRHRGLSVPKQVFRSYHRMGRSLRLQPGVRGIIAYAWFHDPAAVRDYPHLQLLSEPYVNHGGLIVTVEPASPSSGVLQGNSKRRDDFTSGKVAYKCGFAVWPRDAAIAWSDAHPEYGG
jgi:hypothetical protein